jgi:hypothetical protein
LEVETGMMGCGRQGGRIEVFGHDFRLDRSSASKERLGDGINAFCQF